MASSSTFHSSAQLIPLDFKSPYEQSLLHTQRVICTWSAQDISIWAERCSRGDRLMYWICLPASSRPSSAETIEGLGSIDASRAQGVGNRISLKSVNDNSNLIAEQSKSQSANTALDLLVVGHIALDKSDYQTPHQLSSSAELASGDGRIVLISSLFILPQFSKGGLGSFAVRRCEELAHAGLQWSPSQIPSAIASTAAFSGHNTTPEATELVRCHTTTIHTLHPKHCLGGEEGPQGMGIFGLMGLEVQARSNAGWFEGMGYERFGEARRYKAELKDGSTDAFWCVLLRKKLREA